MCSHTKFLECETECACSVPGYLQCALERGIAFPCVQQERLSLQGYCTDRPLTLSTASALHTVQL